jgi:hypothetical protein
MLVSFDSPDLLGGEQHYSIVKSSELLPSLHDGVCGRASLAQGHHVRFEFCVGYCQEPEVHFMLVLGPVAFLKPTAPGRAGYYCGGSTFVTTPHESDSFHVCYAGEMCVDIKKANVANLSSRSLSS